MLTIKAPITLVNDPGLIHNSDNFQQKIIGNYQMLQTNLEPEDFLHLVTAPPEVYLGEGGMTQLIDDTDVYQNQDIKLELINNVINRIVLAETNHITYQDQVFISNILRKLGIRQVDEFMKQVSVLKQETKNTEELINLYWNHSEEIRQLAIQYKQEQKQQNTSSEAEEHLPEEQVLRLHQQIMERLQTAAIYQEVKNFSADYRRSDTYIRNEELLMSEQAMVVQNVLLNRLQNITHMEQEPLVYQHINAYEYYTDAEGTLNREYITNRLIQATMLNIIDRVFSSRLSQIMQRQDVWYQLTDAFYHIADNTVERFGHYYSQVDRSVSMMKAYSEQIRNYQDMEIVNLKKIFENADTVFLTREYNTEDVENIINHYAEIQQNHIQKTQVQLEEQRRVLEQREYKNISISKEKTEENIQLSNEVLQFNNIRNEQHATENYTSTEPLYLTREYETDVENNLTKQYTEYQRKQNQFIQQQHREQNQSFEWNEQWEEIRQQNIEENNLQLQQELSMINQKNVENQQKFLQLMSEQKVEKQRIPNKERMRQEGLKAIANPQEVLMEFHKTIEEENEENSILNQEFMQILSPETREIFQALEQYRKNPRQMVEQGIIREHADGELIRDLVYNEQVQTQVEQERIQAEHLEQYQEMTEHVMERWNQSQESRIVQTVTNQPLETIELVHKQQEQEIGEELLEELIQQNRTYRQNTVVKEQTIDTERIEEKQIHNIHTQTLESQMPNIERMIQQGMRSQLGDLSEQVYNRLEKRLNNERMRRGK